MPRYSYRAVHSSGRVMRGLLVSANENELAHTLSQSGMELITAQEKSERAYHLAWTRQAPPRAIASFCERMQDLLKVGLPLIDALRDVTATTQNPILRDALTAIIQHITNGGGIAASFALLPSLFPPVLTAMLAAGEQSGDMAEIFNRLATYTTRQAQTQERLHRALRYPIFLFLVAGGAVAFMLIEVVPQIVQFLSSLQGNLPLSTRLLVSVSAVCTDYGATLFSVLASVSAILFITSRMSPAFAELCDGLMLRVPLLEAIITKSNLARFAHSFSLLFASGSDVPTCLAQARDTITNRSLKKAMHVVEQKVQSGSSLSQAVATLWPSFAVSLLRIGERSGNLARCLDDIAVTYDREAQAATDSLIGALEPGLTLAIGAVLVWTVLAVLGPLYGSLSVLGGRM